MVSPRRTVPVMFPSVAVRKEGAILSAGQSSADVVVSAFDFHSNSDRLFVLKLCRGSSYKLTSMFFQDQSRVWASAFQQHKVDNQPLAFSLKAIVYP